MHLWSCPFHSSNILLHSRLILTLFHLPFFRIYWFYMQIRRITDPNKTLFTLTQTFRYLNCCCNVFLYSATSSLFRRELKEIFQCSNATKNSKAMKTTLITQARISSSPALHPRNIESTSAEQKKLLATNSPATLNQKPVEEICTSTRPTNGHIVSFKT